MWAVNGQTTKFVIGTEQKMKTIPDSRTPKATTNIHVPLNATGRLCKRCKQELVTADWQDVCDLCWLKEAIFKGDDDE